MPETAPAEELRTAANLMRERAQAMRAEMDRMVATWEPGYRDEVCASLGGPAGEMAAPWDPPTVEAVADLLDRIAWMGEMDPDLLGRVGCDEAIAIARAYLGTSPEPAPEEKR